MSDRVSCEARALVAALIGPMVAGDCLKNHFYRVARRVGLSPRRVRAIWHFEARRIDAVEMDALRAAVAAPSEKVVVNDIEKLRARIVQLENMVLRAKNHHSHVVRPSGVTGLPLFDLAGGADCAVVVS